MYSFKKKILCYSVESLFEKQKKKKTTMTQVTTKQEENY